MNGMEWFVKKIDLWTHVFANKSVEISWNKANNFQGDWFDWIKYPLIVGEQAPTDPTDLIMYISSFRTHSLFYRPICQMNKNKL